MRQLADVRKQQLLEISLELAEEIGYRKITRQLIADRAKISVSLVTYHFKTMIYLKKLVIQMALKQNNKSVIAQAILMNDPLVKRISKEDKRKILKEVAHAF